MAYKLDIFETLGAIERKDYDFLDRKTEEERKGFAPPVVLRWASALKGGGIDADFKLLIVNEQANLHFHDIWQHPELQYKLLAATGMHTGRRFDWIPMAGRGQSASEVHLFLSKYWPEANEDELNLILKQHTRESYHAFVNGCGLDQKSTDAAIGAYDKLMGHTTGGGKKKSKSKA